MSDTAFVRCVMCDKELRNCGDPFSENQPVEGTAFRSYGHYGSTAFDAMDGSWIEVNFCDPCLRAASVRLRVGMGRSWRPVSGEGVGRIGREYVQRPMLFWHHSWFSYNDEDEIHLDFDEIGKYTDRIEYHLTAEQLEQVKADAINTYLKSQPAAEDPGPEQGV